MAPPDVNREHVKKQIEGGAADICRRLYNALVEEQTTVTLKGRETLWDVAAKKYKCTPPLGAIYEANNLTPTIAIRNGKRNFIAPEWHTGQTLILPALHEVPDLERKFQDRMALNKKGAGSPAKAETPHVTPRRTEVHPAVQPPAAHNHNDVKVQVPDKVKVHQNGDIPHTSNTKTKTSLVDTITDAVRTTIKGIHSAIYPDVRTFPLIPAFLDRAYRSTLNLAVDGITPTPSPITPAQGSYYEKRATGYSRFCQGITAEITLGTPTLDPSRVNRRTKAPHDGFSIYGGATAQDGHEVDCGLTWEPTVDGHGKVSQTDRAWRPSWLSGGKWGNAPAQEQYYWHPGDRVIMSVTRSNNPGYLNLSIADAGPNPRRHFSTEVQAQGISPNKAARFKAVTAIDQAMGAELTPTRSTLLGTEWHKTNLILGEGSLNIEFPLQPARRTDYISSKENIVIGASAEQQSRGAERVDIYASRVPKR